MIIKSTKLFFILLMLSWASACTVEEELGENEAKEIAKQAYIFAYPMLQNYKTLYQQLRVDGKQLNQFYHRHELLDPRFTLVVGPNNDTLYSSAWLDLRDGPIELHVPEIPQARYYSVQLVDMYVHNMGYIGQRATGSKAGRYLVVGPNYEGEIKNNYDSVFTAESQLVFALIRILAQDESDQKIAADFQRKFAIKPLQTLNQETDTSFADLLPVYDAQQLETLNSIELINFLLSLVDIHPSEKELLDKFSVIGIGKNTTLAADKFSPSIQEAIAEGFSEGQKAIREKTFELGENLNGWRSTRGAFGPREVMQGKYLLRAAAAMLGLYGNDDAENMSMIAQHTTKGEALDGSKHQYEIHFANGKRPPVEGFWSLTIYTQPNKYLYVNEINRYSIGDRTQDLKENPDGSLTIYLQNKPPSDPVKLANWLPAPADSFGVALRNYLPKQELLSGAWQPPAITVLPLSVLPLEQ